MKGEAPLPNSIALSVRRVPSHRFVGWASIAGGTLGLLALGVLILALQSRAADTVIDPYANRIDVSRVAFRAHDLGTGLQALLMIPAVLVSSALIGADRDKTRRLVALGLIGQITVALFLLLAFASNASDMLYMLPQGLVGLWLILVSVRTRYTRSRGTTWIGIVAGIGLVIIAMSVIGIAVALGPAVAVLNPAAAPPADPAAVSGTTNSVAHQALAVGTLLGRTLYPLWAILLGIRFMSGTPAEDGGGRPTYRRDA